jgi:hypothetical protein
LSPRKKPTDYNTFRGHLKNLECTKKRPYKIIFISHSSEIQSKHGDMSKYYLTNVIRSSDLVASIDGPTYRLVRPENLPAPYDPDFIEPKGLKPDALDHGTVPWYMPDTIQYVPTDRRILNPLTKTLQCLRLNVDVFHPKHELVPFMLKAMPQLRSFGNISVIKALKLIRDLPHLRGISIDMFK